jgi:hypothetical protein
MNGHPKIWRHANPSPYGDTVFQFACNGVIYAAYDARATAYTTTHATGVLVASMLVILSATLLTNRFDSRLQCHRTLTNAWTKHR